MEPVTKKSRPILFIYDIKEIITLFIFWLIFSSFTFTLGVHFGKQLHFIPMDLHMGKVPGVKTWVEKLPENQSISARAQSPEEVDSHLREVLHEEVVRTGLHIVHPEIVRLPERSLSSHAGATTLEK